MAILLIGVVASIVSLIVLISARKAKRGNFNVIEVIVPIIVFMIFFVASSIKSVGATEVGVLYSPLNGGIQDKTLSSGWHFTNPLNTVYKISTTQKQIKFDSFSAQTVDSEYADFIVEIKYRIPKENAYKIYQQYAGMPSIDNLRSVVQRTISSYTTKENIYDILGGKFEEVRQSSFDDLKATLSNDGIELIELNFIEIDAGEQIEQAIVNKGILKQEQQQAEEQQEIARIEKDTKEIQAETEYIQKQKAAEAEAYRITKEAAAQAEAIRLIIDQLQDNPDYIEYIKWSNWDGQLPDVLAGDSSSIIVDSRTTDTTTVTPTN